jgi:hypothetical protein
LRAGQLFYIPPVPHDSWGVGDQPYVSLHFLGAESRPADAVGRGGLRWSQTYFAAGAARRERKPAQEAGHERVPGALRTVCRAGAGRRHHQHAPAAAR